MKNDFLREKKIFLHSVFVANNLPYYGVESPL